MDESLEKRISDLEVAFYAFVSLQFIAQGLVEATDEEREGVEVIFAAAMTRIRVRARGAL